MIYLIAGLVAGYLLGSISFAVVVSKVMGLADPRTFGSKNPGATNVLRTGNKAAALATLLGDALKGTAAVLLAYYFQDSLGYSQGDIAMIGVAAFIGHLFPIFFQSDNRGLKSGTTLIFVQADVIEFGRGVVFCWGLCGMQEGAGK